MKKISDFIRGLLEVAGLGVLILILVIMSLMAVAAQIGFRWGL